MSESISPQFKEHVLAQFQTFGQTFCYLDEFPEVVRLLSQKYQTFNFKIELLHGGIYINRIEES